MRQLTLDEKISIKGKLSRKGVAAATLAKLAMRDAVYYFWRCYGRPVAMHSTPKMFHRVRRKQP